MLRLGSRLSSLCAAPRLAPLTSWVRHASVGAGRTMKRRFRGLFGGKHIQFGNTISFSHRKSRRNWKPNSQEKRFWSETYQRFLQFRCTTSVIKQVKRLAGGIDEYLRTTPNNELLYQKAIQIKRNMRRDDRYRERAAAIAALEGGESAAAAMASAQIEGFAAASSSFHFHKGRRYEGSGSRAPLAEGHLACDPADTSLPMGTRTPLDAADAGLPELEASV